jgi:hypothetical protein
MKKPLSHVIDEQAVEIFKAALPKDTWTVYAIQPDYGKDHKVELVENEDHTGLTFWVQVKGQQRVKRLRNGLASFELETKHLEYYSRLTAPAFLVVVDVTKRIGYWMFLQEYERTVLRGTNWRIQKYIQIKIPPANVLSDLDRLRAAVRDARRFLTRLFFQHDVRTEKMLLEERDPRFRVNITVTPEGRHYHFESDELVPLELTYKGEDSGAGRVDDLLDRGLPVVFRPGEIELEGESVAVVTLGG